ncbi:MAG: ribbon-helix-helix domain-containing protein [Armatimonadota bacterium]
MARTFNISLPEKLVKELDRRAKAESRSRSEVLRAAALAYLNWWKDWRALRVYGRRKAKRLGLRPTDVGRLIREVREDRWTSK